MTRHTQERILDAARRTLFDDPGASIDDIAKAAGVGRATIFRHFENRAGLLKALAHRALAETDRVAEEAMVGATSATDALRRIVVAIVGAGDPYRFLGSAGDLFTDPDLTADYERQLSELTELVVEVQAEGSFRGDVPVRWIVRMIDAHLWAASDAIAKGEVGRVQAQQLIWDTLRDGLSSRPARGVGRDDDAR